MATLTYCCAHNISFSTIAFTFKSFSIYGLLTKREVKMAGYWPSSFSAYLWTETKSRSINTQKDLLYDLKHQKIIFDLAGTSEKSRAGKMEPITARDLVHLARSRS